MKYKVIKKRPGGPDIGRKCELDYQNGGLDAEILIRYDGLHPRSSIGKSCDINLTEYFEEVKELPISWEDGLNTLTDLRKGIIDQQINDMDDSLLEYKCLFKLMVLRDIYRGSYQKTWTLDGKNCIKIEASGLGAIRIKSLSFPTKELRDKFQENFSDLIDAVIPLFYS